MFIKPKLQLNLLQHGEKNTKTTEDHNPSEPLCDPKIRTNSGTLSCFLPPQDRATSRSDLAFFFPHENTSRGLITVKYIRELTQTYL